jgi:hypothetical protein
MNERNKERLESLMAWPDMGGMDIILMIAYVIIITGAILTC